MIFIVSYHITLHYIIFHFIRNQTKGLLRLIEALDAPLDDRAFTLPINTVIVSGVLRCVVLCGVVLCCIVLCCGVL